MIPLIVHWLCGLSALLGMVLSIYGALSLAVFMTGMFKHDSAVKEVLFRRCLYLAFGLWLLHLYWH